MKKKRFIVHVDMDAFFAAIEQRDNPQLRGKPVVVGADPKAGKGRGVVSTCSYEARKFGIHSAMPISIAYKKCPHAIFLPVDGEKYHDVSRQIYKVFYDFTPDVEPISIDEAFLDISGSWHLFGSPFDTCLSIKAEIKDQIKLTASVGLAPIKMAAKIASDLKKPDGMVEVTQEGLLDFLWPLNIRKIWGLGERSEDILHNMGIRTIGDLAKKDVREIIAVFGKNGDHFWQLANGIDDREIEVETEAKSISNEFTFDEDTLDKKRIESVLMLLCEKVSWRLRQEGFKGRTVTLKIRLEGFHTYTRAATISKPTNFTDVIYQESKNLYDNFERKNKKVRLLGVKASNFFPSDFKDSLFREQEDEKREGIHKAVDGIRRKFGENSIYRARGKLQ
ncbi:MAG: DNA polymerase IV [Candidatus Omnitrophica bacterium]|nr:DNA polymerase IV [Candidatus Omnitrophota bacterium]